MYLYIFSFSYFLYKKNKWKIPYHLPKKRGAKGAQISFWGTLLSRSLTVGSHTKLHEEDDSSIVDGGQLPYRIQAEQYDVGKAS